MELKQTVMSNRALMARIVRVSSFDKSPVEFSLADNSGSIKGIWYMGPQVSKKDMQDVLQEDSGVFLTQFKIGRNVVICGASCKMRK